MTVGNAVPNIETRINKGLRVKIKQGAKSYSVLDLLPVNFDGNDSIRRQSIHALIFRRIDDER